MVLGPFLATSQTIDQLVLVNADNDQDLFALSNQDTIFLQETGRNLNIRADLSDEVGSVRFSLNNTANFQTENVAPYSLAGDSNGDYQSWTPTIGTHVLTATAYKEENAGGPILSLLTLTFQVVEQVEDPDLPDDPGTGMVSMNGELKKWHKVTLSFDGPLMSEKRGYFQSIP